jgi:hypothetical protein
LPRSLIGIGPGLTWQPAQAGSFQRRQADKAGPAPKGSAQARPQVPAALNSAPQTVHNVSSSHAVSFCSEVRRAVYCFHRFRRVSKNRRFGKGIALRRTPFSESLWLPILAFRLETRPSFFRGDFGVPPFSTERTEHASPPLSRIPPQTKLSRDPNNFCVGGNAWPLLPEDAARGQVAAKHGKECPPQHQHHSHPQPDPRVCFRSPHSTPILKRD